jgi:hypothetical protein
MKRSGIRRLGLIRGVTTTGQGFKPDERNVSLSRDLSKGGKQAISNLEDGVEEGPNESSLLPLPVPRIIPSAWSPPNVTRLVIAGGTLVVLLISILTGSKAVDPLLTIVASATAYYFGAQSKRRVDNR